MHYMIDPPSSYVLSPSPHVLDCELRAWATSLLFETLIGFGYPRPFAIGKTKALGLVLVGLSKRDLLDQSLRAYDEVSNFGYDEDTADIVLESFINTFQAPFWSLIPDSDDPAKDLWQKQERTGVSVSESQIEPPHVWNKYSCIVLICALRLRG